MYFLNYYREQQEQEMKSFNEVNIDNELYTFN